MTFIPSTIEHDLDEDDVRAIVCLLGEVIAMRGDIHQSRRRLMDGLCGMIHADRWFWFVADLESGKDPSHSVISHDGFENEELSWILEIVNHPSMIGLNQQMDHAANECGYHLNRIQRQQTAPESSLFLSEAGPCWRNAGIGSLMLSLRPVDPGIISALSLYRKIGSEPFTARDAKITHILLTEVHWLHSREFPKTKAIPHLYPRHRTVFNLLCEGWDRKKIANHLGISVQTVHGYVKEIFRHFEVHSQTELVSRMGKGNGGDV